MLWPRSPGCDAVSLQPAAGAQGELTALLVAAAYFRDRGESTDQGADPRQRPRHQPRLGAPGRVRGRHDQERRPRAGRPRRLQGQARRPDRRVHDHQPEHGRPVRPAGRRDRPPAARPRGAALPRRRQHERDPRRGAAGRHGGRPDALQPPQDLLRPARRRRARRRADRGPQARWPRTCPPRSSPATTTARIGSTTTGPSRSAASGRSSATPASSSAPTATSAARGPTASRRVAAARRPERQLPDVAGPRTSTPCRSASAACTSSSPRRGRWPATGASARWTSASG